LSVPFCFALIQSDINGIENFVSYLPQIFSIDTDSIKDSEKKVLTHGYNILSQMLTQMHHDCDRVLSSRVEEDREVIQIMDNIKDLIYEGMGKYVTVPKQDQTIDESRPMLVGTVTA